MNRMQREILEQQLARALRLALEPTDALSRERLARAIEDIEFQLQQQQPRKSPDRHLLPPCGHGIGARSTRQNSFSGEIDRLALSPIPGTSLRIGAGIFNFEKIESSPEIRHRAMSRPAAAGIELTKAFDKSIRSN